MSTPGENVSDGAPVTAESKVQRSRIILFVLLLICATLPLFVPLKVPNKPDPSSMAFYEALMAVPDGSTVIIQSDWTNSTRGESGGQMEAVCRVLMRKNCKLAMYAVSDAQAPQVARLTMQSLNEERKANKEREYEKWKDYVVVGFFPNAEGTNNAMVADIRAAWAGKKDVAPDGTNQDVFNSPVLKDIHKLQDCPLVLMVETTNAFNIFIERIAGKVNTAATVTGVMGPESQVYYASGQLKGLVTGLKGVYDLETCMENGINKPGPNGAIAVSWPGHPVVEGWPGMKNFARGNQYYLTLHAALILLIFAVITGNVVMFRAKRRANSGR